MQSEPGHRVTHASEGELGQLDEVSVPGPGDTAFSLLENTKLLLAELTHMVKRSRSGGSIIHV